MDLPLQIVSVVLVARKRSRQQQTSRVARHGPFVLSTEGELRKAFIDYQSGRLAPNQAEFLASGGPG